MERNMKPQVNSMEKKILEGFIAWLSTRENVVTISKYHTADEALDLVNQYLKDKEKK